MGIRGNAALGVLVVTYAFTSVANASTIQVTTSSDDPVSSGCSLRDAITAANSDSVTGGCAAGSGDDTIVVPAGTYKLTHAGKNEFLNATGDLNILRPVTISGAGPDRTTIDGNGTDRVFSLGTSAGGSTIQGVTITHGHAPSGNQTAGTTVSNDPSTPALGDAGATGGAGGGIQTRARLTLADCVILNNQSGDGGAGGTRSARRVPVAPRARTAAARKVARAAPAAPAAASMPTTSR